MQLGSRQWLMTESRHPVKVGESDLDVHSYCCLALLSGQGFGWTVGFLAALYCCSWLRCTLRQGVIADHLNLGVESLHQVCPDDHSSFRNTYDRSPSPNNRLFTPSSGLPAMESPYVGVSRWCPNFCLNATPYVTGQIVCLVFYLLFIHVLFCSSAVWT